MDDITQIPVTDDQVSGDQTVPATPATSVVPAAHKIPVVEEPGIEEAIPEQSPSVEPEEKESFEDIDADDTQV